MTEFSRRIHDALDYATFHHRNHVRKDADKKIPYASHLFGVAYILAQHDFDEDVVVAGILHDFIEDVVVKEMKPRLEDDMTARFGDRVHLLVRCVTQDKLDVFGRQKAWETRGEEYRTRLLATTTPNEARAISCADKIHNIESLLMAVERMKGNEEKMWRRLKASPEKQLEKFRQLHLGIKGVWTHPLVDELGSKVDLLAGEVERFSAWASTKSRDNRRRFFW